MKNFSTQKLLIVALLLMCAASTPLRAEEPGQVAPVFNGRDYIPVWVQKKVGEPHEIKRAPLFDNLPFLKLKAGDKLMKGKRWFASGKGGKAHFDTNETYFLLSKGKYYRLETIKERGDRLVLGDSSQSVLFDWDVNLAAARQLAVGFGDEPITLVSFVKLKDALRKEFPESLRDVGKVEISKPHLVGNRVENVPFFRTWDSINTVIRWANISSKSATAFAKFFAKISL